MRATTSRGVLALLAFLVAGCSGMKLVNPNDPGEKNKGTVALDLSGGEVKVVGTYTCQLLVPGQGARVSAVGKTETEARQEAVARCRDKSVVSFCKAENARCSKN